jgi:hypothetical protein
MRAYIGVGMFASLLLIVGAGVGAVSTVGVPIGAILGLLLGAILDVLLAIKIKKKI